MLRLAIAFILIACVPFAWADTLRVHAAASLKGPLDQAVAAYQSQTGQDVRVSYAASSLLARQILQGAPADVYWAANQVWMDVLIAEGVASTAVSPLSNGIALAVSGGGRAADIADICETGRIITARTDAVPLGQYVKSALQTSGQWPLPDGCLIETDNARAALVAVLRAEVQAGFLYTSDIFQTGLTPIFELTPPDPVLYPLSALSENGQALVAYLTSDTGRAPFLAAGFVAHGP